VRTVRCLDGTVEIELVCEPVFDYGRSPAEWRLVDDSRHSADASGAGQTIRLRTDLALGVEGDRARARHVLSAGEECYCALSWAEGLAAPGDTAEATSRVEATTRFWRNWLGRARLPDHRWRDPLQRSALAIKGLTYLPTGATVAALTTSLPETPGGERNWDYRYTWMRDTMILLHVRRSSRLPRRLWPIIQSQAECATAVWREPDQGISEARGKPQHYVSSKLMGWVALDRASRLAEVRSDKDLAATWGATAAEIKDDILAHGVDKRGVLRQHYDTDALDASTLLAAIFGFLPHDDKRLRASVLTIADELTENGFVLRYRTDETDDGLSGKEGTFLICSFWLVSALALIGEEQRARDLMERLLRIASPLGLFAEEFDVDTGRHLGNFPQAFSHLALIEAAERIIAAERLAEFS
jgi:GH15 family glucan-1,4-alpha-glucosidase